MAFIREPIEAQVRERVRRDFGEARVEEIMALLSQCQHSPPDENSNFIQMAILRLVDGRQDHLQQWIDLANVDWRDVLWTVQKLYGTDWEIEFTPRM